MVMIIRMIRSIRNTVLRKAGDERGSYTVETALFLPVFIIAVVSVGSVIRVIGVCENVNHTAVDETALIAAESYVKKTPAGDRTRILSRIEEENKDLDLIRIKSYRYLYSDGETDDLISLGIKYRVSMNMPFAFRDGADLEQKWLTRGFTGARSPYEKMPFSEMEDDGSGLVWVFPESGQRYHGENCTYVKAHAREVILTAGIKSAYSPCHLCGAGDIPEGGIVYCFFSYGEAYHKADCRSVDRYTVQISRSEAEEKGYTPCSKCGGN